MAEKAKVKKESKESKTVKDKAAKQGKEKNQEKKEKKKEVKNKEVKENKEKKIKEKESDNKGKKKQEFSGNIEDYNVVLFPLITEKAVNVIESENKLTFIVTKKSSKSDVKRAIENIYNVRVDSINTVNDMKGRKKAIVKINKEFKAQDIATKLGVL